MAKEISIMSSLQTSTPPHVKRLPRVIEKTGLSRATSYAYIKKKRFPPSIPLGSRSVGWLESKIDKWITSCIAMRVIHGQIDTEQTYQTKNNIIVIPETYI